MSRKTNSYRQILHSSSIIGGASVINIAIGLVRTKVSAVLLGPAGVGLIGLMVSLMSTASAVSALGFGSVGTRQVAEASGKGDESAVAAARRALFWGTMGLSLVGAGGFWLLRDLLAEQVLHDPGANTKVGWLAIGVALSVASGSQTALLNGLRRIGDLARLSIASGLFSTILGVGALLLMQENGLMIFVLSGPISSFILGHWFANRIGKLKVPATPITVLLQQWRSMAMLGMAFMVSGLVVTVGQLVVRTMVQRKLGAEALGHFQAAWTISMTYIGFVLGAMGTDYYPRLTAAIHDHETARRMVNEQTEVALLLAGPVFLLMEGLAPWVIHLLYARSFDDAITILRWQIMGDLLKVMSWPMGFITLALGDGRKFMFAESVAIAVFVLFIWIDLPLLGVQATGIGFLAMYVVLLPLVYFLAMRSIGFKWDRRVAVLFLVFLIALALVFVLSVWSEFLSGLIGAFLSCVLLIFGLARISAKVNLEGRLGKITHTVNKVIGKIGFSGIVTKYLHLNKDVSPRN